MFNNNQVLIPINKINNVNTIIHNKQIALITIDEYSDLYQKVNYDIQTNKSNIIKIQDDFNNELKFQLTKNKSDDYELRILFYNKVNGIQQENIIIYFQDENYDYINNDYEEEEKINFQINYSIEELQDLKYNFTTLQFKQSNEFDYLFDVIGYEDNIFINQVEDNRYSKPTGINIVNDGRNNTYTILKPNIDFNSFYDGLLIEIDFFEHDEYDDQVFLFLKSFNNESIVVRFEKNYQYKTLYFDFLYKSDFYSWYQNDSSQKISITEEENNTFQIRLHQNKILFYCNNKFLKEYVIDPTEFILESMFFQVGLINQFSLNSSLYLQGLRVYNIYKYDLNYNKYFNNSFIEYRISDSDVTYINYSKIEEFESPSKIKIENSNLPYFIDLEGYIGESYVDLQFKNFQINYSKRVSVLNKVLYDKQNFLDIENFIWRQLTPKFIREQQYENQDYLWTELVHIMQDFVQKMDSLGKNFGDLFHPFQTDMYLKKTLYFRFKELNILKNYFDLVENNQQIFTLLSLEFFKEILEYYVNRGNIDQIKLIFDNQFKNLSQSMELFIFYFSQNSDIQILPYQYPTKMKEFNLFIQTGGLEQIFEQQKIQLYDKNKKYFKSLESQLYKSYKNKRLINSEKQAETIINEIVDNLLKNQIYRHIIVLFDQTSLKVNNFKEQLIKFLTFIKNEYLPQNMDFLFIENKFTQIDMENENIFDFAQLKYNIIDEPELFFRNIKNQQVIQGSLKKENEKITGIVLNQPFKLQKQ